jgi:hypothetical protein
LDFCRDLGYITLDRHKELVDRYESVGKRMTRFHQRWQSF